MKNKDYKYLIGKKINRFDETTDKYGVDFINFYTDDEEISICKFEQYCSCYVGEYIDEIDIDGKCNGIITNIEEHIKGDQEKWYNEANGTVYKGDVTFYFENGKINMDVHGEDNGYYGVSFTMPVYITKLEKEVK